MQQIKQQQNISSQERPDTESRIGNTNAAEPQSQSASTATAPAATTGPKNNSPYPAVSSPPETILTRHTSRPTLQSPTPSTRRL